RRPSGGGNGRLRNVRLRRGRGPPADRHGRASGGHGRTRCGRGRRTGTVRLAVAVERRLRVVLLAVVLLAQLTEPVHGPGDGFPGLRVGLHRAPLRRSLSGTAVRLYKLLSCVWISGSPSGGGPATGRAAVDRAI